MAEQLTIKQVLLANIQNLSMIRVPAGMINEIGIPISRTIHDLTACVNAIESNEPNEEEIEEETEEEN